MLVNVRIGARLLLLVAVQCVLVVIVGFTGLSGMAQSNGHEQGVYEESIVPLLRLAQVLECNFVMRAQIDEALVAEGVTDAERLAERIKRLDAEAEKAWKEYASTPMNDEERKLAEQSVQAHHAMMAAGQQLVIILGAEGRAAATEFERRGEWAGRFEQWQQTLNKLVEYQARGARTDYKSADEGHGRTHL
jgi:methyl-accepting chemotaxis protein-1 (serine sensor receptor)